MRKKRTQTKVRLRGLDTARWATVFSHSSSDDTARSAGAFLSVDHSTRPFCSRRDGPVVAVVRRGGRGSRPSRAMHTQRAAERPGLTTPNDAAARTDCADSGAAKCSRRRSSCRLVCVVTSYKHRTIYRPSGHSERRDYGARRRRARDCRGVESSRVTHNRTLRGRTRLALHDARRPSSDAIGGAAPFGTRLGADTAHGLF